MTNCTPFFIEMRPVKVYYILRPYSRKFCAKRAWEALNNYRETKDVFWKRRVNHWLNLGMFDELYFGVP